MSVTGRTKLKLPPKIKSKLIKYQRRIWMVKLVEGVVRGGTWVGFVLDRRVYARPLL